MKNFCCNYIINNKRLVNEYIYYLPNHNLYGIQNTHFKNGQFDKIRVIILGNNFFNFSIVRMNNDNINRVRDQMDQILFDNFCNFKWDLNWVVFYFSLKLDIKKIDKYMMDLKLKFNWMDSEHNLILHFILKNNKVQDFKFLLNPKN